MNSRNNNNDYRYNQGYVEQPIQQKTAKKWVVVLIIMITLVLCATVVFVSMIVNKIDNTAYSESTEQNSIENVPEKKKIPTGGLVEEKRLYDDHVAFVETIKNNLNIPNNVKVTYSMDEPQYQKTMEQETVYVCFEEKGVMVAGAECSTADGALQRRIHMYTPPVEPEGSEKKDENDKAVDSEAENKTIKYVLYGNEKYGYKLEIPESLKLRSEVGEGVGAYFLSEDESALLVVYGAEITESEPTRDAFYDYVIQNLDYVPTYHVKKTDGFVVSGTNSGNIFYEKYIVKSDGTVNCFRIKYPQSQKVEYDEIITHMAESFKSGVGERSAVEK